MTTRISGSRRSTASGRSPGSRRRTRPPLARFGDARFAADRDTLAAIFDRPDNIPLITRRGEPGLQFLEGCGQPARVVAGTTLDSFREASPNGRSCSTSTRWRRGRRGLDLERRRDDPGRHDRAILLLSRGGGDAVVLREFDLASREFVAGGFDLPEAKGGAAWLDRDTLLLSSALGEGMATNSGYARTVRLWRRGTDRSAGAVIFETSADRHGGVGASSTASRRRAAGFVDGSGSSTPCLDRRPHGPKTRLDLPTDASARWHRGWLAVKRRTAWTIGDETYPPDTVLGISFDAFLAGDRRFTKLFEPAERRALQGFFWSGGRLVLSILDDLKPVFEALTPSDAGWPRERITGLPDIGVANVWPLDVETEESNGDLLAERARPADPAFAVPDPARARRREC